MTVEVKFSNEHIRPILDGEKRLTVRYGFDKELTVRNEFNLLDEDGRRFGVAEVDLIAEMTARQFYHQKMEGHRVYGGFDEFREEMNRYYPDATIEPDTVLTVIGWQMMLGFGNGDDS